MIFALAGLLAASGAMAGDTEFSGFVDASYFHNITVGDGEFGLDQVEVDIIHKAGERFSLRADLEWIKDGDDYKAQIEQGYMTYVCPGGWDFTFGKFNAPIGFELLDAPDMYQFSHALVFDYGLPTNLTGLSLARDFGEGFDFIGHVSNGWDAGTDKGGDLTFGGRLGYATAGFSGGLSAISGKEELDSEAEDGDDEEPGDPLKLKRTVFDVDLSYTVGKWLFGGEYNMGQADTEGEAGADHEWQGFLVMTHVDYSDWGGFTFRYDYFDDQDGWAFETVDGLPQKIQSFTFCPTFTITEGFGALVELRIDKSNRDGFIDDDGLPTDGSTAVAFEMTYSW
jgi:hypothetical protein